jgi:hypothetical protein
MRFQLKRQRPKRDRVFGQAAWSIAAAVLTVTGGAPAHHAIAAALDPARAVTMVAWPAPVGHRQPRGSDIPADRAETHPGIDMLDLTLDRRLTICRGC